MKTESNIEIIYSVPTEVLIVSLPSGRVYTESCKLIDYPGRVKELSKFFAQATRCSINGVRNLKVLAQTA